MDIEMISRQNCLLTIIFSTSFMLNNVNGEVSLSGKLPNDLDTYWVIFEQPMKRIKDKDNINKGQTI